ncbi:DMT family transporter [Puniceibacterium confluentis]|uniref:DMT family transporter n=1 Tax=Puniceibacterium confluentis TaxID=1958944 RepID=UPI0011B74428|nr:DMT family transporter [Puniceibacterium confluentis]
MNILSDNSRGALLMASAMTAFALGDAMMKATAGAMPLGQIMSLRGALSSIAIFLLARRLGVLRLRMSRRDWQLALLRSLAEVGAAYFFLTALFHMPLANLNALLQMLPLTVTLGSALVFRDPVGWRRWLAIAVGFGGMLLIVKPGTEGFNAYTLHGLIAVLFVTVRDLVTRRLSASVPSLTVTLLTALSVTLFALALTLQEVWVPLTPRLGGLIGLSAVCVVAGYMFGIMAMRVGDVSFVAPFRYSGLLWALVLGLVMFGEWPRPLTLVGVAVIVATGAFTLWREARLARTMRPLDQANTRRM